MFSGLRRREVIRVLVKGKREMVREIEREKERYFYLAKKERRYISIGER